MRLADVAPRLAAARDAHEALMRRRRDARRAWVKKVADLEGLVAHRELHLIRSLRRKGAYVAERQRKLEDARRHLERIKSRGPLLPPL
jgi:hypothetical protein